MAILFGPRAPVAADGSDTDTFIDTSNQASSQLLVYGPKASGAWPATPRFVGHSQIHTGRDLPTIYSGQVGDFALVNGVIYGPKLAAGTFAGPFTPEDGVAQVETLTVLGTIGASGAGNATAIITGARVVGSPLSISFAVANNDTATLVAGKLRTALAVAAITNFYTIGGSGAVVTLTAIAPFPANDATFLIALDNGTCTGLTAATSVNTTAGGPHAPVVGVAQVETATVVGTITGDGNATVILTSAGMTGSPKTISVPVVTGDLPSVTAAKIRNALEAAGVVNERFYINTVGATVVLTRKAAAANDATLNLSIDNGTCTGLTTAASSANTTAGVAAVA